jgi:hypothetical protein
MGPVPPRLDYRSGEYFGWRSELQRAGASG